MAPKWLNFPLRKIRVDSYEVGIEDWQQPQTWFNTWATITTAASGEDVVSFYKDPFGIVRLRGRAARGTPVGALATENIFQLPSGYWPTNSERFAVVTGTAAGNLSATVRVTAAGVVAVQIRAGTTDQNLSFGGVAFRATADN